MNNEEKFAYQWIGVATCFCVGIWFAIEAEKNLIPYLTVVWRVLNAIPIYGLAEMNSPPTQAELDRSKLYEASKIQREKERQDENKIKEKEKNNLLEIIKKK